MCTVLNRKIKGKRKITGYKIVNKVGKKYHSPITGIEYIPGKLIPKIRNAIQCILKNTTGKWITPEDLFKWEYVFKPNFVGYTTIFKRLEDAKCICHNNELIVKMTLSTSLYHANYEGDNVYVGKKVVNIEEI